MYGGTCHGLMDQHDALYENREVRENICMRVRDINLCKRPKNSTIVYLLFGVIYFVWR